MISEAIDQDRKERRESRSLTRGGTMWSTGAHGIRASLGCLSSAVSSGWKERFTGRIPEEVLSLHSEWREGRKLLQCPYLATLKDQVFSYSWLRMPS